MIVKNFEGISIKDAIQSVKKEFGQDAVIISTSEQFIEGTNSKIYEVRAAAPSPSRKYGSSDSGPTGNAELSAEIDSISNRVEKIDSRLNKIGESVATKTNLQNVEGGIQELKYLVLDALKRKDGSALEGLPDHLISIERVMRLTGIADHHIAKLVSYLESLPDPSQKTLGSFESQEEFYKAQAVRWMVKKVKIAPRWSIIDVSSSIHAFVGPTGSGKTTSIAKLAAHYIREEKKKVLLVSYDDIRLAASEQLRIYAKVLGCQFAALGSADKLESILLEHRDTDLVLIDTSGRYPKHENQIQDLKQLSQTKLPIDFHLVLSITEKEEHLDRSVRGFSPLGISSLLFGKLDESWTFGEIFNLNQKWSIPLSFFSTGQKVPDDLERSSRERVVERIFGL